MPKATVYNMAGQSVGEIELSEAIFGTEPNEAVLHEVVKNHLANLRQGTQSALTRAEVSGGGRKPYRQKGTGRARHGSTRAVQWTHGGVAFAPKPRTYRYAVNKKVKRLALKSALSAKAAAGNIIVVDDLNMDTIKTKEFQTFLNAVGVERKAVVVTPELREAIVKSARNIPGIQVTTAKILNVYDILNAQRFVVDKSALAVIEEVFA
ncbi:MAG: 50S ribosomal protein L4 [Oscillospiraceae bacterium]|jgi:large subunit ribosomal protein L4